ncbi:NAD(P)H-binding protein [Actinoplanes sp. NPDC051470]|uniref:SDR family oxidoreductase n=1 Tax=Actinoplanes sp. NPDC051470 TaxID=3157224 RepID=UPI00343C55E2
MTTILVTGASGNLGSALLPRLTPTYDVRPMSRRSRPGWVAADLATGKGVSEAVRGADVVVHLASSPTRTRATDVEGTRLLARAAATAGVRHFLYMSIIGIDRVPLPYYRRKLEAESVARLSGVPFTLLRAAQFPQLIDTFLKASSRLGPSLIDRRLVFQPVAVEDVAGRIAELIAGPPVQGIVEFGGPRRLTLDELATAWKRGSCRPTWPIHIPGRFGRELRAGALTTSAEPRGTRTWEDYLSRLSAEAGRGRG